MSYVICSEIRWTLDARILDLFRIPAGNIAPLVVPSIKVREFREQERCLQFVKAAVASSRSAHLRFLVPPVLPQLAKAFGHRGIISRHGSAVAERAEILRGRKAEAPGSPEAPCLSSITTCSMSLCTVLDHGNTE